MVLRFRLAKTTSGGIMARSEFGDYVRYEDYQKLEAELEQLRQQVKAPADDGWIEWGGGECPVETGTLVDVRYRDGQELYALPANEVHPGARDAQQDFWENHDFKNDIVAYRIVAYRIVRN